MRIKNLAVLLPLLAACQPKPILFDEYTAGVVVEEVDDTLPSPDETLPVDAGQGLLAETPPTRMHVLEDIKAVDGTVTIKFRAGRAERDSIRVTSQSGGIVKVDSLSWHLNSPTSAMVSVKVFQTTADALGRIKKIAPVYQYWVQIGPQRTVQIPSTLDATGQTNVCEATGNRLQTWLASLPNGTAVRGTDGARYRCDYGIRLTDKWNLTFTGKFTLFTLYNAVDLVSMFPPGTIKVSPPDAGRKGFRHLSFVRGGNISIDDLTISGPRPRPLDNQNYIAPAETQHGIEFKGTNGITLRNIRVEHVWGDFLYLGFNSTKFGDGLFAVDPSRHVEVVGTFQNSGRQGVAITGLYNASIHNSTFSEVQRSLWDLEPGGTEEWLQDIDIYSNRIVGRVRNNVVANHGSGRWVQDIKIRDNDFGQKAFQMSFGGNTERRGLQILRNIARVTLGSPGGAVQVSGFDDIEIVGNTMPLQAIRKSPAVEIANQRTRSFTVRDNIASGARVMWRWVVDKRDPNTVIIEDDVQVAP